MLPSIASVVEVDSEEEEDVIGRMEDVELEERGPLKDIGMVDVSGRLMFDEEANPDEETRENTEYNAASYVFGAEDEAMGTKKSPHTKRITLNTCTANVELSKYELDFIQQSADFVPVSDGRTILVAYNGDQPSTRGLEWVLGRMCADNDTIVVVTVVPLATVLSRGVEDHYVRHEKLFQHMKTFNIQRHCLRLVYQVNIGNIRYHLERACRDYQASMMVLGTQGLKKSKLGGLLGDDQGLVHHFMTAGKVPIIPVGASCVFGGDEGDYNETTFVKRAKDGVDAIPDPADAPEQGRTSRFLRAGRSMAHSMSRTSTSESRGERSNSPRRALSPFGLFKRH